MNMPARELLRRASDHGVQVALRGDKLQMTAPSKPPDDLLAELRQRKVEIIAFLSRPSAKVWSAAEAIEAGRQLEYVTGRLPAAGDSPANSGKPNRWDAADYKALFDERAAIAEFDSGLTRSEAESRAIEHCINEWLSRNPSASPPERCLWCGEPESTGAAIVPFGKGECHAWLHSRCWPAWYRRRRADALTALRPIGIPVPVFSEPFERNSPTRRRDQPGLRIAAGESLVPLPPEARSTDIALQQARRYGAKVDLIDGHGLKMSAAKRPPGEVVPEIIKRRAAAIAAVVKADGNAEISDAWIDGLQQLILATRVSRPRFLTRRSTRRRHPGVLPLDRPTLIRDAKTFLARWGAEAARLGWTAEDLFGLHATRPTSRYDVMGLVPLLCGREVTSITADRATIRTPSGGTVTYYRDR
jgi:hypothetical protein